MTGPTLIAAIRDVIGDRPAISTHELLTAINDDQLDARSLARTLRPYGIHPRTIRLPGAAKTPKGYVRTAFPTSRPKRVPLPPADLSDLADVEHDDGTLTDALQAARCRCEQPLPEPDDGELRCTRCGHGIAGRTA